VERKKQLADMTCGEGNWKPSQPLAKILETQQSVSFGLRFFAELQENPIPIELILGADKRYGLTD
jgi:hypothetical protein